MFLLSVAPSSSFRTWTFLLLRVLSYCLTIQASAEWTAVTCGESIFENGENVKFSGTLIVRDAFVRHLALFILRFLRGGDAQRQTSMGCAQRFVEPNNGMSTQPDKNTIQTVQMTAFCHRGRTYTYSVVIWKPTKIVCIHAMNSRTTNQFSVNLCRMQTSFSPPQRRNNFWIFSVFHSISTPFNSLNGNRNPNCYQHKAQSNGIIESTSSIAIELF